VGEPDAVGVGNHNVGGLRGGRDLLGEPSTMCLGSPAARAERISGTCVVEVAMPRARNWYCRSRVWLLISVNRNPPTTTVSSSESEARRMWVVRGPRMAGGPEALCH
jgi:hypothetical protein